MTAVVKCPLCEGRGILKDPDDHTYTAIGTARVTVRLTGNADVLDYHNTELDLEEGFRDLRCGTCSAWLDDVPGEALDPLNYLNPLNSLDQQSADSGKRQLLLKVLADVNLNDHADQVGKQAAAHSALMHAAHAKGLAHHTAGDPAGTYVEAQVVGTAAQLVPLLATLAGEGHSYEVQIDTDDESLLERVERGAAGGIQQLHYAPVSPPPMP